MRARRPRSTRPGALAAVASPGEARSLGRVLDFMRLLWAVDHGLTSVSKEMQARLGVTGPQRLVVRLVGKNPGISAGQLARLLHVHPSTLTGVLRRLTERGVLVREQDPADMRRALFRLTHKGLQVDALRSGTVEDRIRTALAAIPERDVAVAARVLEGIAAALARTGRRGRAGG